MTKKKDLKKKIKYEKHAKCTICIQDNFIQLKKKHKKNI